MPCVPFGIYPISLEDVYCPFIPMKSGEIKRRPPVEVLCTYINAPLDNYQEEFVVAELGAQMCKILAALVDGVYGGRVFRLLQQGLHTPPFSKLSHQLGTT
jgi:hypothetical protein